MNGHDETGGAVLRHGEYKIPGGKLVVVDLYIVQGRLRNVQLSGDFFLEPDSALTMIDIALEGLPANAGSAVVMLDGKCAFGTLDDPDLLIHWGAYLGTPDEIILSGRLGDVGAEIVRTREEARRRKGWIMDTYLLRKSGQ